MSSIVIIFVIVLIIKELLFRKTTYYKVTHNGYVMTRLDKGRYGEYLSYKHLRKYEENGGKFLFNLYLPKEDGETTEIDVLLICTKGIFVIESKNYSGWIFGSENQKMWTQTLPQGKGKKAKKEHFLNPIMQNKLHIRSLRGIIDENIPYHSIIAFSDRCTLKDVTVTDSQVRVINRSRIGAAVNNISAATISQLEQNEIDRIYELLYPYSQVSKDVKAKHIENINKN